MIKLKRILIKVGIVNVLYQTGIVRPPAHWIEGVFIVFSVIGLIFY